ncbi:MAG: hypothetical protein M3Y09_08770 [Actinomycetota bacterium]|nr:hypothetical protein [Actinomycetota bacterium]
MAVFTEPGSTAPPTEPARDPAGPGRLSARTAILTAGVVIAAGLFVARTSSPQLGPVPSALRGVLMAVILFAVCGDGAAVALVPRAWTLSAPGGALFALPLGAALSGLALTALGLATVPLSVSLWIVLAIGAGVSGLARARRRNGAKRPRLRAPDPGRLAWAVVPVVLVVVALAPAWRYGLTTIYGQNPDAHQVAGIAVLFQHTSPTGTDVALPIDTVPSPWRFRYPIFYPLAAAAQLGQLDPITVFPAIAGLLLACLGLGFGAFAVLCLRAPPWSGPLIAVAVALSVSTLHSVWHPYWNQLWGMAMFPWALVFGWRAVLEGGRAAIALFALMLLELGLAYPLALPYPILIIGALALAHQRWRAASQLLRSRSWVAGALTLIVLLPAVAGAALKLAQGVRQLFSSGSPLWGGDIVHPLALGTFVGTGGGIVPALAVLGVAGAGLVGVRLPGRVTMPGLPRRSAFALGIAIAALCLLDLRFRLDNNGAYIDFKHLSFLGMLVLTVAGAGLARWADRRSITAIAVAGVLTLAWAITALPHSRREMVASQPQVGPELFALRRWADELPRGASVRVDVPASGLQLWAVYMLGSHPVDAPAPLLYTTYAHAVYGLRADYALSLRHVVGPGGAVRATPRPLVTVGPPLRRNDQFELWRIRWPARLARFPDPSSQALVEP